MSWAEIYSYIINPILFFGLFVINIVIVTITIRTELRAIKKNEKDITCNMEHISDNSEKIQENSVRLEEMTQRLSDFLEHKRQTDKGEW
jgi:membrane protein insertase Oxa1/YidC/SpoIIIJ